MTTGTPIGRHCILILRDGNIVIDWGSGHYQDIITGETTVVTESNVSHNILEAELCWLKQIGLIADFDESLVYITGLPERSGKPQTQCD